jgi:hypothetical protein
MSHTCHAHGCSRPVPLRLFMCLTHWRGLKPRTQAAVLREYRPGQEVDKNPSASYLAVQRFAVMEAAFKPNDEAAAHICGQYLFEAMQWQNVAVSRGEGNPLRGLINEEIRV